MFRSYKNCKIEINGQEILANSIDFNESPQIVPVYLQGDRHSFTYNANNGIQGALRLNYGLTGSDPLRPFLDTDTGILTLNIGGITLESGYLSSYNLEGRLHSPVSIDANILFFDELKGSFSPTFEEAAPMPVFHFTDAILEHFSTDSIGDISDILNFSYSYSANVIPQFNMVNSGGLINQAPDRVFIEKKEIFGQIKTENLNVNLPLNGLDGHVLFTLKHPSEDITETYRVNGRMFQKNFSANIGGNVESDILIRQDFTNEPPWITGFDRSSIGIGDILTIEGLYFNDVHSIVFNDVEAENFTVISNTEIQATIPDSVIDGPFTVFTDAGQDSSGDLTILQGDISIFRLFSTTGFIGDTIMLSGENFHRIDKIVFSGTSGVTSGEFDIIDSTLIDVVVPDGAQWGKIAVFSGPRGISGESLEEFVPYPEIEFFSPDTGFSGLHVILSGKAFASITGVQVNNINATILNGPHEKELTIEIPSGNTFGLIRVLGQSGVFDLSESKFKPQAIINSISPATGNWLDEVTILGENFMPEIMLLADGTTNIYGVEFEGGETGLFERINFGRMDGVVPYGAETGPIGIVGNDTNTYLENTIWTRFPDRMEIIDVFPNTGEVNGNLVVQGSGFVNLFYLMLSGDGNGGVHIESGFSGHADFVDIDTLGKQIILDIPANMDTGDFYVVVEGLGGIDWSDEIIRLIPEKVPGSFGISGVAGDQFSGNYGTFSVSDIENGVAWYNLTNYDMRLTFPANENIKWDDSISGQPYPLEVAAKDNTTVTARVGNESYFSDLYIDMTGLWESDDGFSGNMFIYATMTP